MSTVVVPRGITRHLISQVLVFFFYKEPYKLAYQFINLKILLLEFNRAIRHSNCSADIQLLGHQESNVALK